MSERLSSSYLEPPRKSVELEDAGAQDTVSNSDDEHFSDASEGQERPRSRPPSGRASPVPLTRVEKVDDNPSYGEVAGTSAYVKREQDAVPDEIEIVLDGQRSRSSSTAGSQRHPTPGGSPIPRTIVEKVDPSQPSLGEIPGTAAFEQRKADAVPDVVTKVSELGGGSSHLGLSEPMAAALVGVPVPETLLSEVDSVPSDRASPGPHAHRRQPSDALPDVTERIGDAPDSSNSPAPNSPTQSSYFQRKPSLAGDGDDHDFDDFNEDINEEEIAELGTSQSQALADDFDDFAEEQGMEDDDFGDFDDGFQEPSEVAEDEPVEQGDLNPQQPHTLPSVPPLIDFDAFQSLPDLYTALGGSLDSLYPASKNISSLPPVESIDNSSAIFDTERSLSLWSQLVAPPPLQPQNWVKSRIRRLFLISLGVPIDLDEILPASKQKKLILPSINLSRSDTAGSGAHSRSQSEVRKNGSSTAPGSPTSGPAARQRASRRREPSPPPDLDLPAVRRLCATTDAALDGLTDTELKAHVRELEEVTLRASSVLEFWLKRRDGLLSEKEAFEGVIENLVNHARRVRK